MRPSVCTPARRLIGVHTHNPATTRSKNRKGGLMKTKRSLTIVLSVACLALVTGLGSFRSGAPANDRHFGKRAVSRLPALLGADDRRRQPSPGSPDSRPLVRHLEVP